MLDYLNELDKVLFILINELLANRLTDVVMPFVTSQTFLQIVYVLMLAAMLIFGDKRIRWLALFSGVTLLLTDQIAAAWLKPLIARPRPCQVFSEIHLLVSCGAGFSMPSAHAANTFGQAVLISKNIKYSGWPLYLLAILASASRVFVGVHYPGDVLAGALVGILVGLALSGLFTAFAKKFLRPKTAATGPAGEKPDGQSQEQ